MFTIRNSDDASNTTAIVMKASRIQRVAVSRLLICCLAVMTVSTSGWPLYLPSKTSVSSALNGATRNDSGRSSGRVDSTSAGWSAKSFLKIAYASALVRNL